MDTFLDFGRRATPHRPHEALKRSSAPLASSVYCVLNGPESGLSISGGDRHCLEVWQAWQRGGVRVTVFCPSPAVELMQRFEYALPVRITDASQAKIGASRLGYIARTLRTLAVIWRERPRDAAVIYAGSAYFYDLLPAMLLRLFSTGSRLVFPVFHLIPAPSVRQGHWLINAFAWAEQSLMLALAKPADTVIVDNSALIDQLERRGYARDRILLTQMGVRRYEHIDDAPSSDAIYVGRFSRPKGVPTLLEAWKIVTQANPQAVLTLVGRNQDGYDVAGEVRALQLERNTRILTGLSDAQVLANVRRAKIFVTASREEGYGLSVLEALSAGIPCVTFDLEAFRLVFPQGRAVAPEMTASSLASTMQNLLVDTQLRRALSVAGRQSVADRNWESVAERVLRRAMRPTR